MSEIVAYHLKDKEHIAIYDPTSGSGSLLINIGHSASKYMSRDSIRYYAQELKENTYESDQNESGNAGDKSVKYIYEKCGHVGG